MKEKTFLETLEQYLLEMPFTDFHHYHLVPILKELDVMTVEMTLLNEFFIRNETQEFISLWTKMILGMELHDDDYRRMILILDEEFPVNDRKKNLDTLRTALDIMHEHNHKFVAEFKEHYDSLPG